MALTISITMQDVYEKLRAFLLTVVPAGIEVVQGTVNRVAMPPASPGFVSMRAMLPKRIMTNLDRWSPDDIDPTDIEIEQAVQLVMQLDCYGATAEDLAVILSTVLRDEYACNALAPVLSPHYTEDPIFAPLIDGEEQYDSRWIVKALLQYNPVISVPMQFANAAEAVLINVEEAYPP